MGFVLKPTACMSFPLRICIVLKNPPVTARTLFSSILRFIFLPFKIDEGIVIRLIILISHTHFTFNIK